MAVISVSAGRAVYNRLVCYSWLIMQMLLGLRMTLAFLGVRVPLLHGYGGEVVAQSPLISMLSAVFIGMLGADFASGVVHWICDTWGGKQWPFVGDVFIRSFREHHVDPFKICRYDMYETNGDNCMLTLPTLFLKCITPKPAVDAWDVFWFSIALFVALTNQFHKWSHARKTPALVAKLQEAWLILPRKEHAMHHRGEHDEAYCITVGWLNAPLGAIDFWKRTERVITAVTGAKPRIDDLKWLTEAREEKKIRRAQR